MIDDDTNSEDDDVQQEQKITRVGYMDMRKTSKRGNKKSWKAVHCLLIGGSFFLV